MAEIESDRETEKEASSSQWGLFGRGLCRSKEIRVEAVMAEHVKALLVLTAFPA